MAKLKKHFVVIWFVGFVAFYQSYNIYAFLNRFPRETTQNRSFDYSTARLRDIGYISRFLIGERNELLGYETKGNPVELFERRDFDFLYASTRYRIMKNTVAGLKEIVTQLGKAGVEVVIVPIPPKSLVARDQLPAVLPPSTLFSEYANPLPIGAKEDPIRNYHTVVAGNPRNTIDLLTPFQHSYLQKQLPKLYLSGDYHWTSWAMSIATKEIVDHLNQYGWKLPTAHTKRVDTIGPDFDVRLLNLYLLPESYLAKRPQYHFREPIFEVSMDAPKVNGRLIVGGDSHAQRFTGKSSQVGRLLASATGRTFHDLSESGGGAGGAFSRMERENFRFKRGDLFVLIFQLPFEFPPDFRVPESAIAFPRELASPDRTAKNHTGRAMTDKKPTLNP